jgi:hypothetical protein
MEVDLQWHLADCPKKVNKCREASGLYLKSHPIVLFPANKMPSVGIITYHSQ